jgi:hypothetical protein
MPTRNVKEFSFSIANPQQLLPLPEVAFEAHGFRQLGKSRSRIVRLAYRSFRIARRLLHLGQFLDESRTTFLRMLE